MSLQESILRVDGTVFSSSTRALNKMIAENDKEGEFGRHLKDMLQLIPGISVDQINPSAFSDWCMLVEHSGEVLMPLRGNSDTEQVSVGYSHSESGHSGITFTQYTQDVATKVSLVFSSKGDFENGKLEKLHRTLWSSPGDTWTSSNDDILIFSNTGEVIESGSFFNDVTRVGMKVNVVKMISAIANEKQFEKPIPLEELVVAS